MTRIDAIIYTAATIFFGFLSGGRIIRTGEDWTIIAAWLGGMSFVLAIQGWGQVRARRQNHTPPDN